MTSDSAMTCKTRSNDQQAIVATAAARPFVTGVPSRVVDNFDALGCQYRESLPDDRFAVVDGGLPIAHAGSAFLNGLTVTAW